MINLKKLSCGMAILASLVLAGCNDDSAKKEGTNADAKPETETQTQVSGDFASIEKEVEAMQKALSSAPANEEAKLDVSFDKTGDKPTIVYKVTMLKMAADDPTAKAMKAGAEQAAQAAEEQQLTVFCANPQLKEAIEKGVTLKYVTADKDGGEILAVNIDLAKCKK